MKRENSKPKREKENIPQKPKRRKKPNTGEIRQGEGIYLWDN